MYTTHNNRKRRHTHTHTKTHNNNNNNNNNNRVVSWEGHRHLNGTVGGKHKQLGFAVVTLPGGVHVRGDEDQHGLFVGGPFELHGVRPVKTFRADGRFQLVRKPEHGDFSRLAFLFGHVRRHVVRLLRGRGAGLRRRAGTGRAGTRRAGTGRAGTATRLHRGGVVEMETVRHRKISDAG